MISYQPIADKLENLIKAELKKQKLIKTGKLINSINVTVTSANGNLKFSVEAEDYYTYLDETHEITKNVLDSKEFIYFCKDYILKQIEENI